MNPLRSVLFFPGTRPELLAKGLAAGADRVCLDLEDAVAADAKELARATAAAVLADPDLDHDRLVVRINHPDTDEGIRDLEAIGGALARSGPTTPGAHAPAFMVPKLGGAGHLDAVRSALRSAGVEPRLVAMIETVKGLAHVEEIAAARGVESLLFGGLDLSLELGATLAWEPLLYARSRTVHAARLADVGTIDMPFFDVADAAGLEAEARRARALGFTGKAAIHPSQIDALHAAFAPSEQESARARRVVDAFDGHGRGAFLLDGEMIDQPAVAAARATLERRGEDTDADQERAAES